MARAVCVSSQSARHLLQFCHHYDIVNSITRSPAGLPKYRSHFNNNSFYPQVCLTLSRFKYCRPTNTKPTDYNSVFELLVFTHNVSGKLKM